jgi:hypothetical protein
MEKSNGDEGGNPSGVKTEQLDERIQKALLFVSQALLIWKQTKRTGNLRFEFSHSEGTITGSSLETREKF